MRVRIITTVCLLLFSACGGKSGGNNDVCAEGFEKTGSGCVPIFEDCAGPVEIPVLGGGCRAVGVTQCATGFVSDGEGGCNAVLPADPCPPGTMEVLGETECQPVGVSACGSGFVSDGEGGCDAVLPANPCPLGTMEVLGHTDCQPIGDCGTGTWGNIVTGADTVFVDAGYNGGDSDGSDASPFTTVGEALAVVQSGGQIAVAAGEYVERMQINQPVELAGRCAELVTLRGTMFMGQNRPPVTINPGGSGATVTGVTLTGDAEGLLVIGATAVTVEHVQVEGTGSAGIYLQQEAALTIRRSVVRECSWVGILSADSSLELVDSVVRDTQADGDNLFGRGIDAECAGTAISCGSVVITSSVVDRNRESGVYLAGVDGVIESTLVRDTRDEPAGREFGRGIDAMCHGPAQSCGTLHVEQSVVEGNREMGMVLQGVEATVIDTVVRDTRPVLRDGTAGQGIAAACHGIGECGSLRIENSVVEANREMGLYVGAMHADIISTIVRDTAPQEASGDYGMGIGISCDRVLGTCGSVNVTSSLVAGNRFIGIGVTGAEVRIASSVVRDTQSQQSDGLYGRGIDAACDSDVAVCGRLVLTDSVVVRNRDVGVFIAGMDGEIRSTLISDTLSQEGDEKGGRGISVECDTAVGVCSSLTVEGSVVASNLDGGITLFGTEAVVNSTVVRDTEAQLSNGLYGRGIDVECDPNVGVCGTFIATNTLVRSSRNVGLLTIHVPTVLTGVAVLDTEPLVEGPWRDEFGQGIWAVCDVDVGPCPPLQMTSCLVESSYTAGVAVLGMWGFMESSAIRSVSLQPADQAYGYGLQLEGTESGGLLEFDVRFSLIAGAALAGVMYSQAAGAVTGTRITGGDYTLVASQGSAPEVADDNQLSGSTRDELYWGNMAPSPAPAPALPAEID